MRNPRKLIALILTGMFGLGVVPLAGCERHDTEKAKIEVKGPGGKEKGKVTVETKTRDRD